MNDRDFGAGSRTVRWASVVRQMTIDCGSEDVLVYGAGAEALSAALGRQVRAVSPIQTSQPADIVLCDGPLHTMPRDSVETALAELASLTRQSALVIFPVAGIGPPKEFAPARMPLDWWQERLVSHFDVIHARDLGEGEGLALVVPRPGQTTAQAITQVMDAATGQPAGIASEPQHVAPAPPHDTAAPAPPYGLPAPGAADPRSTPASSTRVFIGTEPRMRIAETVLRFSIEQGTSSPVEIVSMDYSKGGAWAGWDMGRPPGRPATRAVNAEGHAVWFTDFTNFRWAIPEVCGFTDRAIFMDVDILVLGDVHELFNLPMAKPVLTLNPGETSVMLFDCSAFRRLPGWPSLQEMKTNGWGIRQYLELLQKEGAFGQLPECWNCLDGRGFSDGQTRLVHYTSMDTQPWRPYPDRIFYRPHPVPAMEQLWFHFAKAAREAGRFEDPAATIQPVTAATPAAPAGPAYGTRPFTS